MNHVCCICGKLGQDGQRIAFTGLATYHTLKSKIVYALDKTDMEVNSATLCHEHCYKGTVNG